MNIEVQSEYEVVRGSGNSPGPDIQPEATRRTP